MLNINTSRNIWALPLSSKTNKSKVRELKDVVLLALTQNTRIERNQLVNKQTNKQTKNKQTNKQTKRNKTTQFERVVSTFSIFFFVLFLQ